MAQPTLSTEETAALNEVRDRKKTSDDYLKPYRTKVDDLYSHYRGLKGLQNNLGGATPPDRDTLLRDFSNEWGSDLVIPGAFWVVETVLPRAIAGRPKMNVLPRDDQGDQNVGNMRDLINQQQQQCQYDLKLEETAKGGYIAGLGAQKMFWLTRYGQRPSLEQRLLADQQGAIRPMWIEGAPTTETIVDDWTVEDIDLADLMWDPFGYKLEEGAHGSLRYVIHRTWRDNRYVLDRLRSGDWSTAAAQQLEEEDVTRMNSTQEWGSAFGTRNSAAGFSSTPRGDDLHEVLEFHDGERVITILDGQVPVVMGNNPARHKQMPFAFFRPTTAGVKQLPGIGIIEPISQLLRELSTLRSQRRDNAALKLAQVFAYSDGAVDVGDLQFFPGAAIPIHGEPRDFLYPVQVGDIPNSSYNEEDRIVQDIERVTGISDTVTGADATSGAASTATGIQMVQAAANVRIQRQTHRLEVELITRQLTQAVSLNQQKVVEKQLYVPQMSKPGDTGPAYKRVVLTPKELAGRFAIDIEGGSVAPKNMPQQIQLATTLLQTFADDPAVDQRALKIRAFELFGFSHPEAYMNPDQQPLNQDVLDRIKQARPDVASVIEAAVAASAREAPLEGRGEASQEQEPQPEQNGQPA